MTLKEKFEQYAKKEVWEKKNYNAEECVDIADDFAIGFAEWVQNNCDEFPRADQRLLLQIYKKEKEL